MLKWEKQLSLQELNKLWCYFILPLNRLSKAYGLFYGLFLRTSDRTDKYNMSVVRRTIFFELFPGLFRYFPLSVVIFFRAIIVLFSVLLPDSFRYSSRHFLFSYLCCFLISAFNSLKPKSFSFHFIFVSIVLFRYAHWLSPFSFLL